jgi:CubicO group peptidase (beta-lactamase class C family)
MRILLVLALSMALTGQLSLTRTFAVHLKTPRHLRDTMGRKIDQLIHAYADARGFNGSVLVARGETILLDKGYGWRDAAHRLPCTGYTRYQIASTTKTFTSTLILRLAAQGRLALTDKLNRWYPQLPFADSVTIEAMLTHTSGIYDFTRDPPIQRANEKTFIGYRTLDDSIAIPDEITDSSVPAGAGAIYSTVEDLYRWHRGLQDGSMLDKGWQAKAYRKFQGNNYGYGWTVDSMAGRLVVSHSGSISGFGSDLERVPDDDVCVVVLSNKSGSTFNAQDLARGLLAILYNQPYSIPKKWKIVHLSPEELQRYSGVYEFPQIGLTFRIWEEDGNLCGQRANGPGPRSTLLPTGDDHFITREGGDAECWIDRKAGTLTFKQRGRTFTGKKSN